MLCVIGRSGRMARFLRYVVAGNGTFCEIRRSADKIMPEGTLLFY